MTPENWQEVVNAFVIQTATEGRTHHEEWRLMLERVGEVAGAAALGNVLERTTPEIYRASMFMTGWAAGDPKRAVEWFQGQPPERQQLLFSHLLSGLARSDPKQAFSLLVDKPHHEWELNVPAIMDGAIQLGGFRAAEDLYAFIAQRPDVPSVRRGAVFYTLAQRRIAMDAARGDRAGSLVWLDHQLPSAGGGAVRQIINSAAQANPARALAWLDERADRMLPTQSQSGYTAAVEVWYRQAPEQLAAWIDANPGHPRRDVIAQAAAKLAPRASQNEVLQPGEAAAGVRQ
ncbi:MAG: hypothetical protein M3463_03450 [Verrucomicrobiota bacterium]|nr:hypothetical protein [Verrucomicrobiota bacterium]